MAWDSFLKMLNCMRCGKTQSYTTHDPKHIVRRKMYPWTVQAVSFKYEALLIAFKGYKYEINM